MRIFASGPVIPVLTARLSKGGQCGFCAVFKDRGEALHRTVLGICGRDLHIAAAPGADGRRSLKTQQHDGVFAAYATAGSK
jgi:hypothetical protein